MQSPEGSGAGDCIVGLLVSELHSSSPGGRPKTKWWAAGPVGRRVVVFAGPGGRHHNGFRLAACPLSGGLEIAVRRFLSIDTHGSSKVSNLGALSQQGCQQTRRRQRRNWRIRVVERGLRSEPAWLRAHPGLRHFELENGFERNTAECLGYEGSGDGRWSQRKRRAEVSFLGGGSQSGHVSNFCGQLAL